MKSRFEECQVGSALSVPLLRTLSFSKLQSLSLKRIPEVIFEEVNRLHCLNVTPFLRVFEIELLN